MQSTYTHRYRNKRIIAIYIIMHEPEFFGLLVNYQHSTGFLHCNTYIFCCCCCWFRINPYSVVTCKTVNGHRYLTATWESDDTFARKHIHTNKNTITLFSCLYEFFFSILNCLDNIYHKNFKTKLFKPIEVHSKWWWWFFFSRCGCCCITLTASEHRGFNRKYM